MKYKEFEVREKTEKVVLPRLLRASYIEDEKNSSLAALHSHLFIELLFFTHGKCLFVMNGNTYEVKKGELLVIPAHAEHTEKQDEEQSPIHYYTVSLQGIDLNVDESNFRLDFNDDFEHVLSCFENIYKELEQDGEYSSLVVQNFAEILMITVLRKLRESTADPEKQLATGSIIQTKEYVDKYFYKNITVKMLAEIACVTIPHYIRSFKKMTGFSPLQYINRLRLNAAVAALTYTNKPISSIAVDVGYSSLNNFICKFKEVYGITPHAYRQREQQIKK